MPKTNVNEAKKIHIHSNESSLSSLESRNYNIDVVMAKVSTNEADVSQPVSNSPNESPSNILKLNDDCLMTIFEYLPLIDLCSVADVCIKFKSNATYIFSKAFSVFDINMLTDEDDLESDSDWEYDVEVSHNRCQMDLVEKALRNFNGCIKSIHLDQGDFDEKQRDQILEFIATFCSRENAKIEKLVMLDITISNQLVQQLHSVFGRLKCLEMTNCTIDSINASLSSLCSQLTELILEDVTLGQLSQKYEKLEKISLVDISEAYVGAFDNLIILNPQLKSLTITDSDCRASSRLRSNFYSLIGSLSELEELKLHTKMKILYRDILDDLNHLVKLKHLKVFSINCLWLSVGKLLHNFAEQNVPIEDLDLRNLTLDSNVATSLSKLTRMKKMRFYDGELESGQLSVAVEGMLHLEKLHLCNFDHVTVADIKETIKNARDLKDLQLYNQNHMIIGVEDFNEICRLVCSRRNGMMLKIKIVGQNCKLDVPAHIIEQNRLSLQVQVVTFGNSADVDIFDYYDESDESDDESDDWSDDESDYWSYDESDENVDDSN